MLIVNPRSFRASKGTLASRITETALQHGIEVLLASEPAQLNVELEKARARGELQLFVLSGDGTVQAIAQYLALLPPGDWRPDLLLLGGGRSNVTALEFNSQGAMATLEAALQRKREGAKLPVEERALLRIEQQGATPQHGFLLAGAMIDAGVQLCRQHRSSGDGWLQKGPLSDVYCLSRLGLQVMMGRSPLPPYPHLHIDTGGGNTLRGPMRVVLATTLLHPHGLYNPYAANGIGVVRMTAVTATAPRFWRRLPRLFTGRFNRDMSSQQGFLSGCYEQIEISGLAGYSLDGEKFTADPRQPLLIGPGPRLRFIKI